MVSKCRASAALEAADAGSTKIETNKKAHQGCERKPKNVNGAAIRKRPIIKIGIF